MRPFDLREFAELRYRDGEPFGLEILELLDLEPLADMGLELLEALEKATEKKFPDGEGWRHIEMLEDQQTALGEIATSLVAAGFDKGANGLPLDPPDAVTEILAKLEDQGTELEALRKELEELKTPKLEYDL